jgi:outer membrane receptor protein involved in Fe transport
VGANSDPCDPGNINQGSEFRVANCAALVGSDFQSTLTARVTSSVGGNPDLEEEEAQTYTIGAVYEPTYFDGLQVAVDYYNIEIDNAVAVIEPITVAENCVDATDLDNSFCAQVDRDATTGNILTIRSGQQNVASLEAEGIDITARYNFMFEDYGLPIPGEADLRITANRQLKNDFFPFEEFPDQVQENLGEFAIPKWIVNLDADYRLDNFTLAWQSRFQRSQLLPGIDNEDLEGNAFEVFPNQTGDAWVHDMRVSYDLQKFGGDNQIYFGINNLSDRRPFTGTIVRPAGVVGRFFFVGLQGSY